MAKNRTIIEKIIAVILIIGSCSLLYLTYVSFSNYLNLVLNNIPSNQVNWLYFFNIYHNTFSICFGALFAGVLLMINKKVGWIIAIAILFLLAFSVYVPSLRAQKYFFDDATTKVVVAVVCFTLFCLTIFTILLLKPFREKYKPTSTNWITISMIIVVDFADRIFI